MTTGKIASDGIEFDMPSIDNTPSGEKITVRHSQCDEFRIAKLVELPKFKIILAGEKDEYKRAALLLEFQRKGYSHLVSKWSLKQECTPENVYQLLVDEPYLHEWLEKISTTDDFFFKKASKKSKSTPVSGQDSSTE